MTRRMGISSSGAWGRVESAHCVCYCYGRWGYAGSRRKKALRDKGKPQCRELMTCFASLANETNTINSLKVFMCDDVPMHPPPPVGVNSTHVLVSDGGVLDVHELKQLCMGEDPNGRVLANTWAKALCNHAQHHKWSWQLPMLDFVGIAFTKQVFLMCAYACFCHV